MHEILIINSKHISQIPVPTQTNDRRIKIQISFGSLRKITILWPLQCLDTTHVCLNRISQCNVSPNSEIEHHLSNGEIRLKYETSKSQFVGIIAALHEF